MITTKMLLGPIFYKPLAHLWQYSVKFSVKVICYKPFAGFFKFPSRVHIRKVYARYRSPKRNTTPLLAATQPVIRFRFA